VWHARRGQLRLISADSPDRVGGARVGEPAVAVGPGAIPIGTLPGLRPALNSVIVPVGVMRPIAVVVAVWAPARSNAEAARVQPDGERRDGFGVRG
jgi:hypothetical protein